MAWAFAYAYVVCQAIWPDSFTAAVDPNDPRTWMELLFLSVTTLTSTGLSDVTPIRPFARALVMVEQLAGLAYVAMLVSRVVALTVLRRTDLAQLGVHRRRPQHQALLERRDAERLVQRRRGPGREPADDPAELQRAVLALGDRRDRRGRA